MQAPWQMLLFWEAMARAEGDDPQERREIGRDAREGASTRVRGAAGRRRGPTRSFRPFWRCVPAHMKLTCPGAEVDKELSAL